jgi:hypothetical protein
MKIKQGKDQFLMPPVGQLGYVGLDDGEQIHPLIIVRLAEIRRLRADTPDVEGRPTHFALNERRGELYPKPDADANLIVRFYPPMVEL